MCFVSARVGVRRCEVELDRRNREQAQSNEIRRRAEEWKRCRDVMPPVDLWQGDHEVQLDTVRYGVMEICGGTGTRPAAAKLRNLVENALEGDRKHVEINFEGVDLCSSVFIDELVGKLLLAYGFVGFTQRIRLVNVQGLAAQLINHSIVQRMADLSRGGA